MSDFRTSFLTYYIQSLGERTREEKRGTKFGFDWIIYNLALSEDWIPHRLPFIRSGGGETSQTKTEPEFGVDLAFLSPDLKTLRVFVLKDEVLKNSTWGAHSFDIDLRNAAAPALDSPQTANVERVEVVLASNKDEDATGVELYNRRVAALGTRVGDKVALHFDRWNLTTIVGKVASQLLTPSLLPQKFFSHFSYICAQFADFRHGSDEWTNQLVPNWRRFLEELLSGKADERCVRLLPVSLLILREHGKDNPTQETGWIDLIEWGMLAAWNVAQSTDKTAVKSIVLRLWREFYLSALEHYYGEHHDDLGVQLSVDRPLSGSFVDTIASAVVAHWHLARIGLLGLAYAEFLPRESEEDRERHQFASNSIANWLAAFVSANPSTMRPVIDLHHIELVLVWGVLWQAGRHDDLASWLQMLTTRLFMRRSGNAQIPFVEGRNSLDLVFEFVATGKRPLEFCESSSVYLTCLMELICSLPKNRRDELLRLVYQRIVLGKADCGAQMEGCDPINLMQWMPSVGWGDRVLAESLSNEGECSTIQFEQIGGAVLSDGGEIANAIEKLVAETRVRRDFDWPAGLSFSVVILGCQKHRSPLPPEIWRRSIFPENSQE